MTQTQTQEYQFQLVNYTDRTFTQQELLDLQSKGILFNYANKHDLSEVPPSAWGFTGADAGVLCKEYNVVENEENIKLFFQLIGETKEKKLPDSFRFKTAALSDYKAAWNESRGLFIISWDDGASSTTYRKDEVESYVGHGYWKIIEEVEVQPVEQGTDATEEPQEQRQEEITLESLDKQIKEAQTNLNHLEYLREVLLNARAIGYKLTKA